MIFQTSMIMFHVNLQGCTLVTNWNFNRGFFVRNDPNCSLWLATAAWDIVVPEVDVVDACNQRLFGAYPQVSIRDDQSKILYYVYNILYIYASYINSKIDLVLWAEVSNKYMKYHESDSEWGVVVTWNAQRIKLQNIYSICRIHKISQCKEHHFQGRGSEWKVPYSENAFKAYRKRWSRLMFFQISARNPSPW